MPWVTRSAEAWLSLRRRSAPSDVAEQVAAIVQSVREEGDQAVCAWTRRLDGVDQRAYRIGPDRLAAALADLPAPLRASLEVAADRIRQFAKATVPPRVAVGPAADGVAARAIWEPVGRAAVYVPAGRFPLASSVLMGVIPAQVAEVPEIAVLTPPSGGGGPDATTLAAAALLGVSEVYAVGGAQAVAAAAYGTETVPAVDVIVGPGNRYVTEAKRQVAGTVRIDGLNGPSEVVIWAEPPVSAQQVAWDVLAQAEHDPDSWALAVSESREWLADVGQMVLRQQLSAPLTLQPGVGAVWVPSAAEAVRFVNAFAPEHLELWGRAVPYRAQITRAGATFLNCPTPLGDYVAGPNHVLPTGGQARRASVLGAETFLRRRTEIWVTGSVDALAAHGARLAQAEGLCHHQAALEAFRTYAADSPVAAAVELGGLCDEQA